MDAPVAAEAQPEQAVMLFCQLLIHNALNSMIQSDTEQTPLP